jgi:MFS family permease
MMPGGMKMNIKDMEKLKRVGVTVGAFTFGVMIARVLNVFYIHKLSTKKQSIFGSAFIAIACMSQIFELDDLIILSRFVHGVGYSITSAATFTAFMDRSSARGLAARVGIYSAITGISMVLLPPIGVLVERNFGFRMIEVASVATAVVAVAFSLTLPSPDNSTYLAKHHLYEINGPRFGRLGAAIAIGLCSVSLGAIESTLPFVASTRNINNLTFLYFLLCFALMLGRVFGGLLGDKIGHARLIWTGYSMSLTANLLPLLLQSKFSLLIAACGGGLSLGLIGPNLTAIFLLSYRKQLSDSFLILSQLMSGVFFPIGATLGGVSMMYSDNGPFSCSILALAISALLYVIFSFRRMPTEYKRS